MNERIKELWYQAVQPHTGDSWQEQTEFMEKFAELLVRETLDQVDEFSRLTKAYKNQGIDPEIDVTKEVLKNFGFTRFPRS